MLTLVPNVDTGSIWTSLLEITMLKVSIDSTILSVSIEMLLAVHLLVSPVENRTTSFKVVKSTPINLHSKIDEDKVVFMNVKCILLYLSMIPHALLTSNSSIYTGGYGYISVSGCWWIQWYTWLNIFSFTDWYGNKVQSCWCMCITK